MIHKQAEDQLVEYYRLIEAELELLEPRAVFLLQAIASFYLATRNQSHLIRRFIPGVDLPWLNSSAEYFAWYIVREVVYFHPQELKWLFYCLSEMGVAVREITDALTEEDLKLRFAARLSMHLEEFGDD